MKTGTGRGLFGGVFSSPAREQISWRNDGKTELVKLVLAPH